MSVSNQLSAGGVTLPTTIRVSRTIKIGGVDGSDEAESGGPTSVEDSIIEVHRFPEGVAPAFAEVEIPLKKTHNYNSGGISIRVHKPCYAEELPEAIDYAYELVVERLQKELPGVLKALHDLSDE